MESKLTYLQHWLDTGSINIFGLPMSGKDTVGLRLAQDFGGRFLSSGEIIREIEREEKFNYTQSGQLWPTDMFIARILPYFYTDSLKNIPLILSSIGRWSGEETHVMTAARDAGHPIKAVIYLDVSEDEVRRRWHVAQATKDRGERSDDTDPAVFTTRLQEFSTKTLPVLQHYQELGLLIKVPATGSRDAVYQAVIEQLYQFAV